MLACEGRTPHLVLAGAAPHVQLQLGTCSTVGRKVCVRRASGRAVLSPTDKLACQEQCCKQADHTLWLLLTSS